MVNTVEDMTGETEKRDSCPRVADFYDGKSVFMTGAAGYLGVVLLETLLELCPGIKSIYILLREKKGVEPDKRKEEMFSRMVFNKVKEEMPEVLEKVQVVTGEVSEPNLGMNEEDLQKVVDNANIVFHCAASINFLKPLKYILQHNSLGTQHAIDVSRKFKRLDAFIYTSTAYGNTNRKNSILREIIYRFPLPAQTFIDEIREGTEETLNQLVSECHPAWPNSYTFSKCLAENILQDNASDLPIMIIRPSIIGSVIRRPLKGYLEETSGITALSIGCGKGFLKVLNGNPDTIFDFTAVDLTAGVHVVAAWSIGTHRTPPLQVINCASFAKLTLRQYADMMLNLAERRPLPKTFRKPTSLKIVENPVVYWALAYYEHYIPGYVFDLFLKMSGSKIRLIRIYKFAEKAAKATIYFMTHSWTFGTENLQSLLKQVPVEDIMKFELQEFRLTPQELAEYIPDGAPFYRWSTDKKSPQDRMRAATQRYWITNGIKTVVIVCISSILYIIFAWALELFK